MKRKIRIILIIILLGSSLSYVSFGQEVKDSLKVLKNTVRVNLTNPLIFGSRNNIIGYERVVSEYQSFTVNIGTFDLPKFTSVSTGSLFLQHDYKDRGYTIATDYRFYLRKENKYVAPRGVFIGPYYSFNHFERENTWTMNTPTVTGNVNTTMHLNINMVGAQLGYQFIIKRRLAIDMILMGPGKWFYNLKTTLNTTLSPDDEAILFSKLNEVLTAKLPGHEILIKPGANQSKGTLRASSAGFRYIIHLGFRF
jgi:hypothetical protein